MGGNVKKVNFVYVLLIVFLSCLLILTGLLAFLWSFLGEYEKTNPKNCINEYVELLKSSNFEKAMELVGLEESENFTALEYERYVKEILGGFENIDMYETSTQNPEERRFELKGRGENTIKLVLTEDNVGYKYNFTGYKLSQPPVETYSYVINLPQGYTPVVNGIELGESSLTGTSSEVSAYNSLNDKSRVPRMVGYEVDGLVFEPVITIKELDESSYSIEKTDVRVISVRILPEEKSIREYEQRAVDASIMYAKYIFDEVDFELLKEYFYEETSYFKSLKEYSNVWTVEHNPSEYKNIKVTNTVEFSKEHYQTEVFIDQVITKGKIEKVYPISYRLSFIKVGDSFKVANLEVI